MAPSNNQPYHIAVCLFPGFQLLDLCGPLDLLNVLNYTHPLKLSLLSTSLDPVSTRTINTPESQFDQHMVPTHTYSNPPKEPISVLFVPGGFGTRQISPDVVGSIRDLGSRPDTEYILSVCTGSATLAQAGLLDGKKATSNKKSFDWVSSQGPHTEWVRKARWVEDGKVWTSSGVAAGMDMTLAWIAKLWGLETATGIAQGVEYEWHKDPSWDPFADLYPHQA